MSWTVTEKKFTTPYVAGQGYGVLLDRYPLLPIKDKTDYKRASAVLDDLFGRDDLDAEAEGYLDTLLKLIGDYEQREHAIDADLTPAELVRHLMESHSLSTSDLGRIIGSQSTASDFLRGKIKGLSVARAQRLADHFRLEIGAFFPRQP